ncbi:MAG: hypothetical protein ACYDCL_12435 [Myxococcales bacterium]
MPPFLLRQSPSSLAPRALPWAVLGAATAAVGWALIVGLVPGSAAAMPVNSDGAIAVLMANHSPWDLFHLYYYGQDRLGAWPFGLAHLTGLLFGFAWTPASLHVVATLWLLAGVVPAALLAGPLARLSGGMAYLAGIALPGIPRLHLYYVAEPYIWQLPALLWAWLLLRYWTAGRRLAPAAAAHFLAIWSSTLSAPMLAALAPLELWRSGVRVRPRPLARALAPAAIGLGAEVALRVAYHRFAFAHFGNPCKTRLRLDWGHLTENAAQLFATLSWPDAWPYLLLAAVAAGLALRELARPATLHPEGRDLAWLALGLVILAAVPLPVVVSVDHVRVNLYDARYLTPSFCFSRAAAFGALALAAAALPRAAWARAAGLGLAVLATAGLLAVRPVPSPSPDYRRLLREAETLATLAPGSPLLNGYWRSYVYAQLLPAGRLLALPSEGDYDRTPFELPALRSAKTVIVGNAGPLAKLWSHGIPPAALEQYGLKLRLVNAALYSDGDDAFALYANDGACPGGC